MSDTGASSSAATAAQIPASAYAAATSPPAVNYQTRESDQLGKRTVSGSLWTVGTYFAVNVVRLASNLILTRLLMPELFGVMLIVTTVMVGIRLFSDVGIGPALIANPRGEDEPFLRTAWTMQVVRGFLIWLAAIALAVPISRYYVEGDPTRAIFGMLTYLLPVAGFVAVIEGLRSTAIFRLQRRLNFAQQSMLDLIEIGVTSVGMVVWALYHPSVWALVVPPLVGSLCAMVASHFLVRDRTDRLGWDRLCAHDLMRIGRWIFLSTVLTFLAGQFDRLIFGKLIDSVQLGIYGIAVALAMMPTIAVLKVGGSVLFPTFSRVADDPVRFANVYGRARTMLLVVGAAIVCCMIASGPFAIRAMYKSDYDDAGWMLQLLAIGVWFQIVDATNVAALLARQQPNWMAAGNLTKVIAMVTLVPIAYHFDGGFVWALVALGVADGLRAVASTIGMQRLGVGRHVLLADALFPLAIAGVGVAGLKAAQLLQPAVEGFFPATGPFGRLLAYGTLSAIACAIVLAVFAPICLAQWKRSRRQG